MTIKEIRTTLMTKDKVTFNIQGVTEYQCIDKETNEFSYAPKILKTHRYGKDTESTSITCKYGLTGMNVTKFGPTSFTVYSFDLLSNRTRSRIKYEDVTIVTD